MFLIGVISDLPEFTYFQFNSDFDGFIYYQIKG